MFIDIAKIIFIIIDTNIIIDKIIIIDIDIILTIENNSQSHQLYLHD